MGKSWKDDDWHEPEDLDEMFEEEQRKRSRRKQKNILPDDFDVERDYIPLEPFRKR